MNEDLKLRLAKFNKEEHLDYIKALTKVLMLTCRNTVEEVSYYIEEIENGEDDTAYILGDGFKFDVYIDNRMPVGMITDYILHELAHADSWWVGDDEEDHCDEFGKSYAKLYRRYLEFYEEYFNEH